LATLFYAPGIQILVKTARAGTIDLSDDITEFDINLTVNAPHQLTWGLANPRRKYDGLFTPNDRVVCRLKRLRWLQVMSGYLDSVPFFTAYPTEVKLKASCTLKRLKLTYWDPGATATVNYINALTYDNNAADGSEVSGNLSGKAMAILTDIAGWPADAIHMGRLPADWVNQVYEISKALGDDYGIPYSILGMDPTVSGFNSSGKGTITDPLGTGLGWGSLPTLTARLQVGNDNSNTTMFFTGESKSSPADHWWVAMRLSGWHAEGLHVIRTPSSLPTTEAEATARGKWNNKKLLVVNQSTGKSLIVRMADWGPVDQKASLATTQQVADALGILAGQTVLVRFAPVDAVVGTEVAAMEDTATTTTGSYSNPTQAEGKSQDIGLQGSSVPVAATSVTWAPAEGLVANVRAARDFIKASWPEVKTIGGVRHDANAQDHGTGHALDVMMTDDGTPAQGDRRALGNSVALWFTANPNVFGSKYVIWYDRINSAAHSTEGWREYLQGGQRPPDPNQRHENHVHLSFIDQASAGAAGNGWTGSTPDQFSGGFSAGGPAGGARLITAHNALQLGVDVESDTLVGPRRLMNDVPVLDAVGQYINTSMRDFCSAPNGDLIAWFPDYFGTYELAGVLELRNIELKDFSMTWTDDYLITHQYTAGTGPGGEGFGGPNSAVDMGLRKAQTMGIATVEQPEIVAALLNIDRNNPGSAADWLDSEAVLQRFGARPDFKGMEALTSAQAEFWYALHLFQRNWANMFTAQVPITFMPELYPGMLLRLVDYGVQFYVDNVTHTGNMSSDGPGFTTTAHISAPSAIGSGFGGLVRGGHVAPIVTQTDEQLRLTRGHF
jgi:hypothetical protein